jgi:hypothetical protein
MRLREQQPKLSKDWVANNDSLAAAAKDAFYLIGSLCSNLWSTTEPRNFLFFVFSKC